MAAGESSVKILSFLKTIEGLSKFSNSELESFLYKSRFELLPPPKDGGGKVDGGRLPTFMDIPRQDELHDMLLSGAVPGGFQCMAHALYPEAVPWPSEAQALPEGGAAAGALSPVHGRTVTSGGLAAPRSSSPDGFYGHTAAAGEGLSAMRADATLLARYDGAECAQGGGEDREVDDNRIAANLTSFMMSVVKDPSARADDGLAPAAAGSLFERRLSAVPLAEVVVCGQRMFQSVRGKAVHEVKDDLFGEDQDDEKYLAARSARSKLQRVMLLEEFEEKKLKERIHNLEHLKVTEIERLETLDQREARRKARREELRLQLEKDVNRKLEEERLQAEEEKAQKEKENEQLKQWKKSLRKQKELLQKWHTEQMQAQVDPYSEEYVRKKKTELFEQQVERLRAKQASRMQTVQRVEAEEKVRRTVEAIEERPPLPPKPHDRPSGGALPLDLAGGRGSKSARREKGDWKVQAKAVSNMYGLTGTEASQLEGCLTRTVRGAGRLAGYASPREKEASKPAREPPAPHPPSQRPSYG